MDNEKGNRPDAEIIRAELESIKKRISDIEILVSGYMETDRDKLIGLLSVKNQL